MAEITGRMDSLHFSLVEELKEELFTVKWIRSVATRKKENS
jgi:hypothetical protein